MSDVFIYCNPQSYRGLLVLKHIHAQEGRYCNFLCFLFWHCRVDVALSSIHKGGYCNVIQNYTPARWVGGCGRTREGKPVYCNWTAGRLSSGFAKPSSSSSSAAAYLLSALYHYPMQACKSPAQSTKKFQCVISIINLA